MDRSQSTVKNYLNVEKTYAAIDSILLKKLNPVKNAKKADPRLVTKNQSLSCFSSFKTQNSECWNFITTVSLIFVI